MKRPLRRFVWAWLIALVFAVALAGPSNILAGSIDDGAKKADQGIHTAGQKVDSSTRSVQNAADATGKKASRATKSGADKVGGFFKKTEKTVEGWMKGLEKKSK